MRCPTVKVKDDRSPQGFVVINESDLTDDHELYLIEEDGLAVDEKPAVQAPQADPFRDSVTIPAYWQTMHWKKQVKLAQALGREGNPSGDEAKAFIELKMQERAAR